MLSLLAILIILLGLYLIVSGLREPTWREQETERGWKNYQMEEEFEELEELSRMKPKREVKGGGVILIGPIPIVFGESKYAFWSLVLAIILMLLSIAIILML
jgi:uncharacterized protein (TIGR00304 family)